MNTAIFKNHNSCIFYNIKCIRFKDPMTKAVCSTMDRMPIIILFQVISLPIQTKFRIFNSIGKSSYRSSQFWMSSQITFQTVKSQNHVFKTPLSVRNKDVRQRSGIIRHLNRHSVRIYQCKHFYSIPSAKDATVLKYR